MENIFDRIKEDNDISNETYDIFGHSAGGQFVHRMTLLMPKARIGKAIAANAGFYTFPDLSLDYPYGTNRTPLSQATDLRPAFQKELVVLLGELDNSSELGTFRQTELAMEQGVHRLERGSNFFNKCRQFALDHNLPFRWEIDTVANVGHNYRKMSQAAAVLLKESIVED